jgi:hypothetical protein
VSRSATDAADLSVSLGRELREDRFSCIAPTTVGWAGSAVSASHRQGAISILKEELKLAIFVAYAGIGAANQRHRRVARDSTASGLPVECANRAMRDAMPAIERAREALLKFLSSDDGA